MLTKSWRILNLNHILKHCHVSLILFVLLVEQINLLEFIVYIIVIHVHDIVLRFSFFFKKLVAIEIILLHEFIHVRSCTRIYARFITNIIYIAKTSVLGSFAIWHIICLCLKIWKVPKEFIIFMILIFPWVIVQMICIILEKVLSFL